MEVGTVQSLYQRPGGTGVRDLAEDQLAENQQVEIEIRRLDELEHYRTCELLQNRIWGREGVARVPVVDLLTAQDNGGLVLGAFDGPALVGFVYSVLGIHPGHGLKHCSVVLAVADTHRRRGIGQRLKKAQRREVLAQGIELITWTFDPLLAVNADLNIRRLGTVSRKYRENYFGVIEGLETDRLVVEWWLRREPFRAPAGAALAVPVAEVIDPGESARLDRLDLDVDADRLLLPIPPNLTALRQRDLGLAQHWREQVRAAFQAYFARGYALTGYRPAAVPGTTVPGPSYELRRGAL